MTTDNQVPYRVYGSQQDNTAISRPERVDAGAITETTGSSRAVARAATSRSSRTNRDIVFGGAIGYRRRQRAPDRATTTAPRQTRDRHRLARGARAGARRRGAEVPLPVDLPDRLLAARPDDALRHLATSSSARRDEGKSWEVISPDLTRNDPETLEPSGGPITRDNSGAENYGTIFAFVESPHEPGFFWAGSDDGLMHVSEDGGKLGERHAARAARMGVDRDHRALAARRRHGLRRRDALQARRLPAVSLQDHRLRQDLDA